MYKNLELNEFEIDIIDIAKTIIKKWYVIILSMAIFFALGAAYFYMDSQKPDITSDDIKAQIAESMNPEEAEDVEWLANQYALESKAKKRYMKTQYTAYMNGSRSTELAVIEAEYLISSDIVNIGSVFSEPIIDEEVKNKLIKASPEDGTAPIEERVIFRFCGSTDDKAIEEFDEKQSSLEMGDIVRISLYSPNRMQCEEMLEIIDQMMKDTSEKLKTYDDNIEIDRITERYSANADASVVFNSWGKIVSDRVDAYDKELKGFDSEATKLTDIQQYYYKILKESLCEVKEGKAPILKSSIMVALCGGVFAGVFIIFIYMVNGTVKTTVEIEKALRTYVLQKVTRKSDTEEKCLLLAAEIVNILKNNNIESAVLICETGDKTPSNCVDLISNLIKENNIDVVVGDPLYDMEVAKADSGGAVVFATLKKSKLTHIYEWAKYCVRHNILVVGSVAIDV